MATASLNEVAELKLSQPDLWNLLAEALSEQTGIRYRPDEITVDFNMDGGVVDGCTVNATRKKDIARRMVAAAD